MRQPPVLPEWPPASDPTQEARHTHHEAVTTLHHETLLEHADRIDALEGRPSLSDAVDTARRAIPILRIALVIGAALLAALGHLAPETVQKLIRSSVP